MNTDTDNGYREWMARHIYGDMPVKWDDVSEAQKQDCRKRADEAVKRMAHPCASVSIHPPQYPCYGGRVCG